MRGNRPGQIRGTVISDSPLEKIVIRIEGMPVVLASLPGTYRSITINMPVHVIVFRV
jgi:hypothetical protein